MAYQKINSKVCFLMVISLVYLITILEFGINGFQHEEEGDFFEIRVYGGDIDSINFPLSKEYKSDKDIVIEIDSVDLRFYKFIAYYRNGNSYYNGFVKKIPSGNPL